MICKRGLLTNHKAGKLFSYSGLLNLFVSQAIKITRGGKETG